ncbi:MAG: hypothetical protein ACI9BK_000778, partial [Acidimicrobiales bacterium]
LNPRLQVDYVSAQTSSAFARNLTISQAFEGVPPTEPQHFYS